MKVGVKPLDRRHVPELCAFMVQVDKAWHPPLLRLLAALDASSHASLYAELLRLKRQGGNTIHINRIKKIAWPR
jgi:hypothetical protein